MGSFSIFHWLAVLLGLFAVAAAVIGLLAWALRHKGNSAPASKLEELARLRQQGFITESEYERKRSELAQRL